MFIILVFFLSSNLWAAPAIPHSLCSVVAKIESVEERSVERGPESWRKSWGLEKEVTYTDIELKIIEIETLTEEFQGKCTLENYKDKSFQLRPEEDASKLSKGKCIQAKTQFSGDEFMAGQWIWDIQECPSSNNL